MDLFLDFLPYPIVLCVNSLPGPPVNYYALLIIGLFMEAYSSLKMLE